MSDINEILNVLFAFKLGIPVVWKDDYCSWWEVRKGHISTFTMNIELCIVRVWKSF